MTTRLINKAEFTEVVTRLMENYRVCAPIRRGEASSFQRLTDPSKVDFNLRNTLLSPKSLMLPQSELMFNFTLDKSKDQVGILREVEKDFPPRVIFGIRPCDAKAFQLLDLNFDTPEYQDPWWLRRRQATTLVGLGCNDPCTTCFCSSVGSGPFARDGLDLLLTDVGKEVVIETITEKGEHLLTAARVDSGASEAEMEKASLLRDAAEQRLKSLVSTETLQQHDASALFNADFWDKVQFACINCGVCTFVCPTCWCFDIQDEVHRGSGVRMRNWDACMFPLFTLHGSGHNPRSQKLARVRQRFMHKLKYFVDKYNNGVACVGCGRCVQQCPVNIDIREVFRQVNNFKG